METTLLSDNLTPFETIHTQTLTFTNPQTNRHNLPLPSPTHHHKLQIQTLPIDAVAPPPTKPTTISKSRAAKRSRVKKRLKTSGFNGGEGGGFLGGGDGGGNGNGDGNGGFGWDDESEMPVDPAFDLVYELLSWFVLSNCLFFAFKRVFRIVVDGSGGGDGDGERRFQ